MHYEVKLSVLSASITWSLAPHSANKSVCKRRSPCSLGHVLTGGGTYGVSKPGVGQPCGNTAQAHGTQKSGPRPVAY